MFSKTAKFLVTATMRSTSMRTLTLAAAAVMMGIVLHPARAEEDNQGIRYPLAHEQYSPKSYSVLGQVPDGAAVHLSFDQMQGITGSGFATMEHVGAVITTALALSGWRLAEAPFFPLRDAISTIWDNGSP